MLWLSLYLTKRRTNRFLHEIFNRLLWCVRLKTIMIFLDLNGVKWLSLSLRKISTKFNYFGHPPPWMPIEGPDNFKTFHFPDNMFNVPSVDFNIFIEYQAPFSICIGGWVRICAAVNPVMRGYLQGYILSPRMNVSRGNGRPTLGLMLGPIGKLLNDCASFICPRIPECSYLIFFFIVYHNLGMDAVVFAVTPVKSSLRKFH